MLWNWIRQQVKQAVLGGVHDAIKELDGGNHADPADILPALRGRMLALPTTAGDGKEHVANGRSKRDK